MKPKHSKHNKSLKVLISLTFSFFIQTSQAFPVEDFITESNTYMTYIKEVQNAINQVQMVKNQFDQLQYEAKNLKTLSGQKWDDAQGALNQLGDAMNQTNSIAYSMQGLDQKFKDTFPGYSSKATTNFSALYKKMIDTNNGTQNGAFKNLQQTSEQLKAEDAINKDLANRARTANGRMEALQVGNEIAAEQIAQLQKLKATIMAQQNTQAEYYAYQTQKDAEQQKSIDAVVQSSDSKYPSYKENPQFGQLPSF